MVAPYATALAAMVEPEAAVRNFARLRERRGARTRTASTRRSTTRRAGCPRGPSVAIVKQLHGAPPGHGARRPRQRPARRRHARSASTPSRSSRRPSCCSRSGCRATCSWRGRAPRRCRAPRDVRDLGAAGPAPLHLAARRDRRARTCCRTGATRSWSTAAGSGYSRWRDLAVTRWREDVTRDAWGSYRLPARRRTAARSGRRATSRAAREADSYEVTFAEDHAEFSPPRRLDRDRASRSSSRPSTTPRSAACR